jgi:two-component system response regulator RegX3
MIRILIVEDESSFSEALEFLLSKEGFSIVTAANGSEAITKFEQGGIDLVLLDLMIPEISGTEVCRQIRAKSKVPIIMLTAKDSEVDKVVGLELGADDYVTKPYSTRELVARIRAVLRRNSGESAIGDIGIMTAGPVRMDTDRHQVTVNGCLLYTSDAADD